MLSKKSKYAIKALVALARKEKNDPCIRIAEISEEEKIPKKFLETILLQLKNNGFLGSKMGVGGGYYLLKDPDKIYLTDVMRLTDGPIALVPCVSLNFYQKCDDCKDEITCGIRKTMIELRDVSLGILSQNSIADIIRHEKRLKDAAKKKKG